jgi:D-alanine transaminase
MSRIAYVNGRYLPFRDAKVHVEDRGYQFADAVYEVCEVRAAHLIDARRHLDRLERSLAALRMRMPMSRAALGVVLHEMVGRNRIVYGLVYLQIGRGVARRDPAFPVPAVAPSLVVTARPLNRHRNETLAAAGISVVSVPDNRWGRVDIKTVGLLPNVLARQAAIEQGAREAWFVDSRGAVTEGASVNAWIVSREGKLVTRHADHAILGGITRAVLFETVKGEGLLIEERAFTLAEACAAREAFISSATQIVIPVVRIDGHVIGDGKPGPVATALRRAFHRYAEAS